MIIPNTLVAGEDIIADDLNENFTAIKDAIDPIEEEIVTVPKFNSLTPKTFVNETGICYDGTEYYYSVVTGVGDAFVVYRYKRIGQSLVLFPIADTALTWINNNTYKNIRGITYKNGYLYVKAQKVSDSSDVYLRITVSDQTITEMSLSGGTLGSAWKVVTGDFDNTYIYFLDYSGGVTIKKWSVSGTTLTYESSITLADKITSGIYTDETNIYFHTGNPGGVTKQYNWYKLDMTGAVISNRYSSKPSGGNVVCITGDDYGVYCAYNWSVSTTIYLFELFDIK